MDTETNGLKPAAMYLRRSTDKQEQSLGDQRREIERYASENGYAIVADFVDDGISGTSGAARPGFMSMIAAAQVPECAWRTLLVWDIKRFGRMNGDEAGHYRHLLTEAGVQVVYTSEGFAGNESDKFLRMFKQEFARDEVKTLSKAVGRGLVSLADQGRWAGGPAPYGYDLGICDHAGNVYQIVRHTGTGEKEVMDLDGRVIRTVPMGQKVKASDKEHVKLVPSSPDRVEIIRRIFSWYTTSPSQGFKTIADRLNREGVRSPKGRGWAQSTIRVILLSEAYLGHTVWNRRTLGKFHKIIDRRSVEREGCGKRRLEWNAPEDWITFENAHEPLIDPATFAKAQRIMKERAERCNATGYLSGKARNSRYLLSGIVKCGACGGAMHGRTVEKGTPRKDGSRIKNSYYVCGRSITMGQSICKSIQFVQDPLEDLVAKLIGERFRTFLGKNGRATLKKLVEKELESETSDPRQEIKRLKARLAENQSKVDNAIDLAATLPEHKEALNGRLSRLRVERRELEGRLSELDLVPVRVNDADTIVETILAGLNDSQRLFDGGTLEEKKRVVRTFVDGIVLSASERVGELRIRQVPMPQSVSIGTSVEVVAGVGFEPTTFGL